MTQVAILGARGTLVIPQKVREELGLKQGDILAIDSSTGILLAEKIKTPSSDDLVKRWNKIVQEGNKRVTSLGIKETAVESIIHKHRKIKN